MATPITSKIDLTTLPVAETPKKAKRKTKAQPKSKKAALPKAEPKPVYSYEFLEMLSDTALNTLSKHLKEIGADLEADLLNMGYCLLIEIEHILTGGTQDVENVTDVVTRTLRHLSNLEPEWVSSTGSITPLKKLLEFRAAGK